MRLWSGWSYRLFKQLVDSLLALVLIVVTLPLQLLIVAILASQLGLKQVFYIRQRPGYKGRLMSLYKFTTLKPVALADELKPNPERAFPFGNWLRKSVLDELPQLYQILFGQMSFVGPRPLLVDYLTRYNERQHLRHTVKPGITGLAQIAGGNNVKFADRLELDAQYAERQSLGLDLLILYRSVQYLLQGRSGEPLTVETWEGN